MSAAVRPLIISQNLASLGRENLFQITPVPDSSQHVCKRDFLQLEIFPLQFQTVPAQGMLFIFKFVLESAHFVQVVPRQLQQGEQFLIQQMLLQKYQCAHHQHHGDSQ